MTVRWLNTLYLVIGITLGSHSFARGADLTRQFSIPLADDRQALATLKLPAGLKAGQKIPVLLIFGGFESAADVLGLIHTDKPIALASFDYPFNAPRKLTFPESLKYLPEAKRVYPDTVRGIAELVKVLRGLPEIDSRQVIAVGASFGAPFVLAAASRDPTISRVVLVHAFGQVPQTAEHVILKSWLPRYGWKARPGAWILSRLLWLYLGEETPESSARKLDAEQRVLMVTARDDSFIPRESSDALWQALEQSRARVERKMMASDHLMPGSDQLIGQIVGEVESWMK